MTRLLGALALAFVLGACQTAAQRPAGSPSEVIATAPPAQVSAAVSTVQRATRTACGFVPSRSTVVALARTFTSSDGSTAGMVAALAQGICTAIHSPEAYASTRRSWRGVTITGRWVK